MLAEHCSDSRGLEAAPGASGVAFLACSSQEEVHEGPEASACLSPGRVEEQGEGEELREGEGQEGEAEAELLGFGLSGS